MHPTASASAPFSERGDGTAGSGCLLRARTSSPHLDQYNSAHVNEVSAPVGGYWRAEAQFTNSTADYLKIGKSLNTGGIAGNGAGAANFTLFSASGLAAANVEIAECFLFLGVPNSAQRYLLDQYCDLVYGPGLT